jgi:hypothetical protein
MAEQNTEISIKEEEKKWDEETRTSRVRIDEEGIVRVVVKPNAEITLEDAKANVEAAVKISGGKKMSVLVDMRPLRSMTREARQHMAGEATAKIAKAQALLVDTGLSKIIGNFLLGLNKPPYPTKMFTSDTEAVEWLRGFDK